MSVLRIYDPAECDERGVPLDWERCRTCGGVCRIAIPVVVDGHDPSEDDAEWLEREEVCPRCDGHGSACEAVEVLPMIQSGAPVEASWRPVDVRTMGWAHDLRPEKLAVLCLRCWVEREAD